MVYNECVPKGIESLKKVITVGFAKDMPYGELLKELRIAQDSLSRVMAMVEAQEPPIAYGNDKALQNAKGQPIKVEYNGVDYLYPSIREAAHYNNISESSIRQSLKRKDVYRTKGRVFSYYEPTTLTLPQEGYNGPLID